MSRATSSPAFSPDLRVALVAMIRKRVPESEVEDIVQAALTEALESPHAPKDGESLRRWIFGVAKNKVVDYHRRAGRESFELPDVSDAPAPHDEADLLRWAERHMPDGEDAHKTLDWMLREGEGEKLESIAASEKLPAPRVRQRVSRLRRHLKTHWAREVALLAALGVITTALVLFLRRGGDHEPIAHDPRAVPIDPRAEQIRKDALERCNAADWTRCVEGLDEAKRLDPAGDARPEVQRARHDAENALAPAPTTAPPLPLPLPTSSPSSDLVPKESPKSTTPFAPVPTSSFSPPSKPSPKKALDKTSDSFGSSDGFGSGTSGLGSGGSGGNAPNKRAPAGKSMATKPPATAIPTPVSSASPPPPSFDGPKSEK